MDNAILKLAYREQGKASRKALGTHQRKQASQAIFMHLFEWPFFQQAQHICCYISFAEEVDTRSILDYCWQKNKQVYTPYLFPDQPEMSLALVKSWDELVAGPKGNMQSRSIPENMGELTHMDLVLAPGVLFDQNGFRLGLGAGYYDRYFEKVTSLKVGLAFDCQRVTSLPKDPWDERVDFLITEKGITKFV